MTFEELQEENYRKGKAEGKAEGEANNSRPQWYHPL